MEGENEVGLSVPYQKIDGKVKVMPPRGPQQQIMGPLHTNIVRKESIGTWGRIVLDLFKRTFRLGNMAEERCLCH